jgi:hypothetical protein
MMGYLPISETQREIPVIAECDIVVVGGGPSGVAAAVAGARMGASVILIEKNGFLGGPLTMHLPIQGLVNGDGQYVVEGIITEFIKELQSQKGAYHKLTQSPQTNNCLIIDPEVVKLVCQEMVLDSGAQIQFHSYFSDVSIGPNGPEAIILQNKSGRQAIRAKFFIDASGDGDVAARSGADFLVGRDSDGYPQSATLTFRVDQVDEKLMVDAILSDPQLYNLYEPSYEALKSDKKHCMVGCSNLVLKAKADGHAVPFKKVLTCSLLPEGAVLVNMTHVSNVRCHEAADQSRAEIEARQQIPIIMDFLRKYMPGFQNAVLTASSHEIGVRETRRIVGEYTLTQDDLRSGKRFSDTIGLGAYPIDIHSPDGTTVDLEHMPVYCIPFRTLIPKKLDNLLVCGRSLSATHEALASVRVMAQCMAMGQAVGTAAALCLRHGVASNKLDISLLQKELLKQHVKLE